jgi:hypothetical protein
MVRKDGRIQKQIRTFGTTTRELVRLREWLLSEGCTHADTNIILIWPPSSPRHTPHSAPLATYVVFIDVSYQAKTTKYWTCTFATTTLGSVDDSIQIKSS